MKITILNIENTNINQENFLDKSARSDSDHLPDAFCDKLHAVKKQTGKNR